MIMNKLLKDILTELDSETYDISKILWILGTLVFFMLSAMSVLKGQVWSPSDYGIGMGAVLVGGGAGVKLKSMANTDTNSKVNTDPHLSANR